MNRSIYVALSCCAFIFLFSGCEEFGIGNKSELPDDIVGYELVIYNTKTISNPDGLNVSNRTVYFFEDRNTIIGQGTNNSGASSNNQIFMECIGNECHSYNAL